MTQARKACHRLAICFWSFCIKSFNHR